MTARMATIRTMRRRTTRRTRTPRSIRTRERISSSTTASLPKIPTSRWTLERSRCVPLPLPTSLHQLTSTALQIPVASTSKLPAPKAKKVAPLAVAAGFNWDGEDAGEEAPQADEDSESDEEVVAEPESKKRGKDVLEDRTGASQAPSSLADFERLLLGSPNSSYIWIQFVAYYLGLSQVDKAREIGRRALKTINFREEQEKLNVWVALLNLENTYGTEASLTELFTEAAQSNDAKTVYLRLVDIYERTGKFEVSPFPSCFRVRR